MNRTPTGIEFPQGCAPGYDSTHPAAIGTVGYTGVAYTSGTFISALTGAPATPTGTTSKTMTPAGPGVVITSGTSYLATPVGPALGTRTTIVMAGIITPTTSSSLAIIVTDGSASNYIYLSSFVLNVNIGGAILASGIAALSTNVPYFVAASGNGSTANFVVLNLMNGRLFTSSGAIASAVGTPATNTYNIGGSSAGAFSVGGAVHTAMYAVNNYMLIPALAAWAEAPWDFWYPPTVMNSVFGRVAAAAAKVYYKRFNVALRR